MRRYEDGSRQCSRVQEKKLMKVVCNGCGRNLKVENGYLKEFAFSADAVFGYFSSRDGIKQHFDLCEECYGKMTAQFELPPEEEDDTELLGV